MVQQRAFALVAAVIVAVCSSVYAEILWKQCDGPANDPSVKVGNFYNLCIRKHKFRDQAHAWTIQKTTVSDTSFENCKFLNTRQKTANYSDSVWTNVKFTKCTFGSYTDKPQHFDKTTFRTVTFKDCVFDKTAELMFSNFLMQNVTFSGCRFESNTLFELGQFIDVRFEGCSFKRSPKAVTVSGDDAITWSKLTVRDTGFLKSDFVTPLRIQSVSGADVFFNESTFGELWCHEKPGGKDDAGRQKKEPTQLSAFNDTVIDKSTFRERVKCDRSTWRGMTFFNTTFQKDADFSRSTVQDIYWDEVNVKPAVKTSECHTLDFSNSVIFRKVLANTTVACEADFTDAKIERVFIHRFLAQRPKFKGVVFTDQEYVDSRCCTIACKPLKCKCNITEPSRKCPEGDWTVNVNKFARCFPASAEVMTANGPVRMEHLEHGHRVAVGGGSHSDVFFFGHRSRERYSVFTTILHSGSEKPLRISPEHYLYVNGRLATAESVRVGDRLRDAHGKDSLTVKSLGFENLRGLYAPTSLHGNLVVDGVLVSSYTSVIHPRLAHFALHPLRLLYRVGLGGFVSRFNVFEEQSMEFLPRMIGLPTGPQTVGK